MTCWFCKHGWPKPIRDIYDDAVRLLAGDRWPLHYGPAHVVWEDENFDAAEWCLENFERFKGDYGEGQLAVVKESLERLVEVPMEIRAMPTEDFDPPPEWECEHR
jgi:hypothetical protein